MDLFIQSLAKLDLATIIILLGGLYIINKSNMSGFDSKFKSLEEKIDKMQETVTDIDRRLCRLEGAFASKDCCMIKDSSQIKKAE